MSLINQMLRDLEGRRKAGGRQPVNHRIPLPEVQGATGSRWALRVVLGVALGGALWFGFDAGPGNIVSRDTLPATSGQVQVPPANTVIAETATVAKKKQQPDSAVERSAETEQLVVSRTEVEAAGKSKLAAKVERQQPPAKVATVAGEPEVETVVVAATAKVAALDLQSKAGVRGGELQAVGVVEGIDSVRLMFEFEKMPRYRVRAAGDNSTGIILSFFGTGKSSRLEVPPFRGPLLTQLLLNASGSDLNVSLGTGKPVTTAAFILPEDNAHGERLLLELIVDRNHPEVLARPSQTSMGDKLRNQNLAGALGTESAAEQAEILTRKAMRYLEQGNEGAAKTQFSRALDLTPGNVELRLRLVDMLDRRQHAERAEKLLIAGLTLAPESPQLRTRYGRLLLEKNQLKEALNLMLSEPVPVLAEQPEYHALLAALEQEQGQSANAATRYRELLQIRPQQADWWLMLGIAYEQLNDGTLSASAYREALQKDGLSTEHRQFALDRLERLQRLNN